VNSPLVANKRKNGGKQAESESDALESSVSSAGSSTLDVVVADDAGSVNEVNEHRKDSRDGTSSDGGRRSDANSDRDDK
jgi:hypothetical protein